MRKRMRYESEFKLKVVEFAKTCNNSTAAGKFNVSEKLIRDWRRNEASLQKMPKHKFARRGGKIYWPELEEHLFAWISHKFEIGLEVHKSQLCWAAKRWAQSNPEQAQNFTTNINWCRRFLRRRGLMLTADMQIVRSPAEKVDAGYEYDSDCVEVIEIDVDIVKEISAKEGIDIDFLHD